MDNQNSETILSKSLLLFVLSLIIDVIISSVRMCFVDSSGGVSDKTFHAIGVYLLMLILAVLFSFLFARKYYMAKMDELIYGFWDTWDIMWPLQLIYFVICLVLGWLV